MPNFAVISNGAVINLIDAPSLRIAQEATGLVCVEYNPTSTPAIGDKFEETPAKTVK